MIICSDCFLDTEIKSRIETHAKEGVCSVCGKQAACTYDTKRDEYLNGIFDKILNVYTPVSSLEYPVDASKHTFIKNEFIDNWNIFKKDVSSEVVYRIVREISKDLYAEFPQLFDSPVVSLIFEDKESLEKNSMLKAYTWEEFVDALKHKNRFHTNYVNWEILKVFCSYIRKTYKKGQKFFRGRISSIDGFRCDEMGAPERGKSSNGRANAKGIRRLYLASDIDTTIHEVRNGAFDYVSIGEFELKEDITVVDFKMINKISPFIEELNIIQYLINKEYFNKIDLEMGKALRRNDSELDYVPTQYIADFIQSLIHEGKYEYAGIEYKSTLNPNGYNVAIFNPDLFECVKTEVYQIDQLRYEKRKI